MHGAGKAAIVVGQSSVASMSAVRHFRFVLLTWALALLTLGAGQPAGAQTCTPGFRQVNVDGFGNRHNLYAWSMEEFNGDLYVGTLNNVDGPEVWRWHAGEWNRVFRRDATATGNTGFRSMAVFGNQLYVSSVNDTQGAELWRTANGTDWEPVLLGGHGDARNTSFRGLTRFGRQLYLGVQNQSGSGGKLYRSRDGLRWQAVSLDGLGDTSNHSLHAMNVFGGMLYLGTANDSLFQIYRSPDGRTWERVVGPGAPNPAGFGFPGNTNAVHLFNYNKRMYVGSANDSNGFTIHRTIDGVTFLKVASEGGGDPENIFAWRFASFEGHLWLGTGNFKPGAGKGGSVLRSQDGRTGWETLVGANGSYFSYGFDRPLNWGIRTVKVFNNRLYFGTAQCWKAQCDPLTTGTQIWEWSGEACQQGTR